jgi:hypothetical protein
LVYGQLVGDVNGSQRADGGDVTQTRNKTVLIADQQNFQVDVNTSGRIDAGDVTKVRQHAITVLPPP